MSRIIDVITLLLLVINFYYMISLGIFGFFLYLKLLIDIFFKKIDKINQRKLINVLSCISVFPSISLFLFLLFDFLMIMILYLFMQLDLEIYKMLFMECHLLCFGLCQQFFYY